MKIFKKTLFFALGAFLSFQSYSQKIPTPYNHPYFIENFEINEGRWPIINDSEGLFTIEKNEYVINRHTNNGIEIIKPAYKSPLSSYRLITALTLEKDNKKDSEAGIIFKLQNDLSGYIFEINTKQEYRLRKLEGVINHYLTGDEKNEGWTKSSFIKGSGNVNQLEVRAETMVYDLYINDSFIKSFADISWQHGDFGLVIGPETSVRVSTISLFTNENSTIKTETTSTVNNYLQNLQRSNDSLIKVNLQLQQEILRLENKLEIERGKPIPENNNK